MSKKCSNCKNSLMVDEGYSNYTVESTTFYCLLDKNPLAPFDRWYGKEPKLEFAEECLSFDKGAGESLDVDRELFKGLSPSVKAYIEEKGI